MSGLKLNLQCLLTLLQRPTFFGVLGHKTTQEESGRLSHPASAQLAAHSEGCERSVPVPPSLFCGDVLV